MSKLQALKGSDKAALLVAMLGEETAAAVVKNLKPTDVARLGAALKKIEAVDPLLEQAILGESHRLLHEKHSEAVNVADLSRRIMTRALGTEEANRILGDPQEESAKETLRNASPAQLAALLAREQSQTIAVVLRQLPSKLAAETLAALPGEVRGAALKGLAAAEPPAPALVRRISLVLKSQLSGGAGPGNVVEETGGGLEHAVELLRSMGRAKSRELMTALESDDPETANRIKDQLFLFEDLGGLPAKSLGEVLRGVDARVLATALKGAEEEIREKFLGALSERAAVMIREEMEYLGGARVQEIEEAQREIRNVALQLEAAGTLNLEEPSNG